MKSTYRVLVADVEFRHSVVDLSTLPLLAPHNTQSNSIGYASDHRRITWQICMRHVMRRSDQATLQQSANLSIHLSINFSSSSRLSSPPPFPPSCPLVKHDGITRLPPRGGQLSACCRLNSLVAIRSRQLQSTEYRILERSIQIQTTLLCSVQATRSRRLLIMQTQTR